jgi:hypothetical protein
MMSSTRLKNRLIASLPAEDFALLSAHMFPVDLEKGRLLFDPGDPIETVYFPQDCGISLMTRTRPARLPVPRHHPGSGLRLPHFRQRLPAVLQTQPGPAQPG